MAVPRLLLDPMCVSPLSGSRPPARPAVAIRRGYAYIDRWNSWRNFLVSVPLAAYGVFIVLLKYFIYFCRYLLTDPRRLWNPIRCFFILFWFDIFVRSHTSKGQKLREKLCQKVRRDGYRLVECKARTRDGHWLLVHRVMPSSTMVERRSSNGKVAFLQHGLQGSSADWTIQGLAYRLVDLGYDVWLGNFRGNAFSLDHDSLCHKKDRTKFWDFSFHEHGKYDLPAMLDLVTRTSRVEKVYYIAHSMGMTSLFIMLDHYPERNRQVEHVFGLAAVTHLPHVFGLPSWFIPAAHCVMKILEWCTIHSMISAKWMPLYCPSSMLVIQAIGYHKPDPETLAEVLTYSPSSTSTRNLLHYIKCIQRKSFTCYSGRRRYRLRKVKCPLDLWWGQDDWACGRQDMTELASQLPNVVGVHEVFESNFGHQDYLWAKEGQRVAERLVKRVENVRNGMLIARCRVDTCECS